MSRERPSIFAAAATGYRDAGRALRAMPVLALTAFGILVVVATLNVLVERTIPAESLFGRDIMSIVGSFFLTPFYIAVHRHVILGEVTSRYRLDPLSVRFQLFSVGWSWSSSCHGFPTRWRRRHCRGMFSFTSS
jgi:hypothetical protein